MGARDDYVLGRIVGSKDLLFITLIDINTTFDYSLR